MRVFASSFNKKYLFNPIVLDIICDFNVVHHTYVFKILISYKFSSTGLLCLCS